MNTHKKKGEKERGRKVWMDGGKERGRVRRGREKASSSGNPTVASASVSSEIVFAPSWLVSSGDSLLTQLGSHIGSTAVL